MIVADISKEASSLVNPNFRGGDWQREYDKIFARLIIQACQDNLAWHGQDESVLQLEWFKINKVK